MCLCFAFCSLSREPPVFLMKVLQLCEEAQDPESFVSRDGETTQSYPGEISTAHDLQCHSHMCKGRMRFNESQFKIRFRKNVAYILHFL